MSFKIFLNMKLPDAQEVKRYFIYTIERINQQGIKINNIHKDKLSFIARSFNNGKLKLPALKDGLDFILNEAIIMANK